MKDSRNRMLWLIALTTVVAIVGVARLAPIPQDPAYHRFADQRILLGLPNFWNVVSNLPFALAGIAGLYRLGHAGLPAVSATDRAAWAWFFFGVALVAPGSAWYHLWPDNQSLVWDRLPMTIAFMALFAIIINEYVSSRAGRLALPLLLLAGVASVGYWGLTELRGAGDLRAYALVQFLPLLLIPAILIRGRSPERPADGYWWLLLAYVLAKLLEYFDERVYALGGWISGHSLKHIVAATGVFLLLRSVSRRGAVY